jgi:hypothetical protein
MSIQTNTAFCGMFMSFNLFGVTQGNLAIALTRVESQKNISMTNHSNMET